MRNGQNKRMRGRNNHRKSHNPMVRVYESNGPDVKIRGNPSHIAEKYIQLARDAQTSGDPIAAENYYQHAEHYYRVIAAAQEQFRAEQPALRPRAKTTCSGARDDGFDDGDDDGQPMGGLGDSPYGTREPQPYIPRDAQPFPQQQPHQPQRRASRATLRREGDVERLPSFITGGQQPQQHQRTRAKASSRARTATTISPTVSRCTADAGAIAARAPTCRAAVDGGDEPHRAASDCSRRLRRRLDAGAPCPRGRFDFVRSMLATRLRSRRERGLERRHQPTPFAPRRDRAIDLLGRLDDMHAGERRRDRRPARSQATAERRNQPRATGGT